MLTVPATRRRLTILASVLTLTGIVTGILVWQLFPQDTASAQAVLEDICEDLDVTGLERPAYPAYDVSEWSTFTHQYDETVTTTTTTTETQVTAYPYYGRHEREYDEDGALISEYFLVVRPDEETGNTARDTEGDETYSLTQYRRSTDDQGVWKDWNVQSEPIERSPAKASGAVTRDAPNLFCGVNVDERFTSFTYIGEETIGGVDTKHFVGIEDPLGDTDPDFIKHEFWISLVAFPIQYKVERFMEVEEYWTDRLVSVSTYSGYGQQNVVNPPGQAVVPTQTPAPTPEPTPEPTPLPTPEPTPEPTLEPTTTTATDAWLEPDPESITFDGQWRQFTIRGTGLDDVRFSTNVINHPDGPNSTGAVELDSRSSLPSASDACRNTYFSG